MQKENRKDVNKNQAVTLNLIQGLPRKVVTQRDNNGVRGRFQIKFGMTSLFDNGGFTLIELLVVVLIIGILAAVAVPQYQKSVEKARASEALPLLKSVYQAAQAYYLANGDWPTKFDELPVEIPWTGTTKWRSDTYVMKDTRSNDLWSMQIYKETGFGWSLYMGRISGKYKGAGFSIGSSGTWRCVERIADGVTFDGNEGDYCIKIMRCSGAPSSNWNGRSYSYQP